MTGTAHGSIADVEMSTQPANKANDEDVGDNAPRYVKMCFCMVSLKGRLRRNALNVHKCDLRGRIARKIERMN